MLQAPDVRRTKNTGGKWGRRSWGMVCESWVSGHIILSSYPRERRTEKKTKTKNAEITVVQPDDFFFFFLYKLNTSMHPEPRSRRTVTGTLEAPLEFHSFYTYNQWWSLSWLLAAEMNFACFATPCKWNRVIHTLVCQTCFTPYSGDVVAACPSCYIVSRCADVLTSYLFPLLLMDIWVVPSRWLLLLSFYLNFF